jgi:hypothetical protein
MKKVVIYLPFLLLMACGSKDEKANNPQPDAPAPLAKSQNSESFNTSFQKMLDNYFQLKEGFVQSKDNTIAPAVNTFATALIASADSVKLKELKADEAIISTAQSYTQGISSEAKALVAEPNLENKRKSFQMISDQLYDLMRTVRYDRQIVYHTFCPMAFNDQGAYWLDRTSDIKNPYFGAKMLTCGEVKDSLDFTPKQK